MEPLPPPHHQECATRSDRSSKSDQSSKSGRSTRSGRFAVGAVGGAAAVVALGGLGTHLLSGTESTTGLDATSTVLVDGHRALAPNIVTGRIESKYHPLPWVGRKVSVSCPTGLKAVAGATVTCVGEEGGGRSVDIPVSVVRAGADSVTWKFER